LIVRRIIFAVVALSALGAASGIAVFAAAFALYAALRGILTPAGAAAAVCFAAALLAAIAATLAGRMAKRPRLNKAALVNESLDSKGMIERAVSLARDRPFVAAGAATAVGLLALANPAIVMAVMRAFISPTRHRRR
jgi:ElaB/YqjD/DUF883 family membrane-anchored ribosome-binding protein